MINTEYLNTLLLSAVDIARQVGRIHLEYFRTAKLNITQKQNAADIVTAADRAAEAFIISSVEQCFPDHSILSEESGTHEHTSPFRWVIDPLDGTTNFSAGLPFFNVSIGIQFQGETVVGVVYAAALNELFHAVKGQGAYLNGEQIHVGQKHSLAEAVVSTGFPYDKGINADNNLPQVNRITPLVRGMRRLGSAALDMSYVSAGFLDAYWEIALHDWDVVAAMLIAQESGAKAIDFRHDRDRSVLVANSELTQQLLPLLQP